MQSHESQTHESSSRASSNNSFKRAVSIAPPSFHDSLQSDTKIIDRSNINGLEQDKRTGNVALMRSPVIQTKFGFSSLQARDNDNDQIHDIAAQGLRGSSGSLPHLDQIQKSFGDDYDVSDVKAHVDEAAFTACDNMGALAYATGNRIAFKSQPDAHTAAHEAAHVVQQKNGVNLKDGIGQTSDVYEKQADAVADRVVAGESVSDILNVNPGTGSSTSSPVQLEADEEETPDTSTDTQVAPAETPAPTTDAPAPDTATPDAPIAQPETPVSADGLAADTTTAPTAAIVPEETSVSADTDAPPVAVAPQTTDIILTALYEEVPGEARDKNKQATENNALWIDLNMHSGFPTEKVSMKSTGVVAGVGEQTVDTYNAPVADNGGTPLGQGSIAAELKYASSLSKSYKVKIDGVPGGKAGRVAKDKVVSSVAEKIRVFGDKDEIETAATQDLQASYPGAKVSIDVEENKLMDAGRSSFFYKVREPSGILMNVKITPVGQKVIQSGGGTQTDTAAQDEVGTKDRTVKDAVDIQSQQTDVHTIDDYVTKVTDAHKEVIKNLAIKTYNETHIDGNEHEVIHDKDTFISNWDANSKETVESGERVKKNWAAKAQDVVGVAKDLTDIIPIPKQVKWLRRLNYFSLGLSLADSILGKFAERGKVKFTDTTGEAHEKGTATDTKDSDRKLTTTITETDEGSIIGKLEEKYNSITKDTWERHMTEVKQSSSAYKYRSKSDESEVDTKHAEQKRKTITSTFNMTSTLKYTKPYIEASVFKGENAEVNNTPFPPPHLVPKDISPEP